ncbi:MAG: hypothetical protein MJ062_06075 [Oscillospiraceae bacterium]|nr:hypothetical protein [Oscillospiraceae bacterium]
MKNTMKKIAAFTAATLMTAALAIPASAKIDDTPWVEDPSQNGLADLENAPYFNKTLTIYNEEELNAYVPAVTYTYAVSSVDPAGEAIITDKDGYQAIVKKGVDGGFALKEAAADGTYSFQFSEDGKDMVALKKGAGDTLASKVLKEKIDVVYDATKFSAAGVYRYALTETSDDFSDYGITRASDGEIVRYVDVYVRENPAKPGEMEVYGSVMFYDLDEDGDVTTTTEKTDGFTDSGDPTGDDKTGENFKPDEELGTDPTHYNGDELYTYNYVVQKVVENSLLGNEVFPFTVTVTNESTATQYFNYSPTEGKSSAADAIAAATTKGTVNTADGAVGLADGQYLALTAVPANALISVSELNDENAVYDVTAEDDTKGALTLNNTTIKTNESSAFSAIALTDYDPAKPSADLTAALTSTVFTNKMHTISPTGLLFMIAPFAAMLAFGVVMITLFVKNKKRDESDDMI